MKKISLYLVALSLLAACTNEPYDGQSEKALKSQTQLPDDAEIIDFAEFNAGDIISSVSPGDCVGTIGVFSVNPDFPGENAAMAFDSSNPTGGDVDLGTPNQQFGGPGVSSDTPDGNEPSNDTPLGIILINSEDLDSGDPDDSFVAGSKHVFDFTTYGTGTVTLFGFDMIDLEGPGAGGDLATEVILYDSGDGVLLQQVIPHLGDNTKQFVDLGPTEDVAKMEILLNNSGGVDNIALKCENRQVGGCETMFGKGSDDIATCFIDDGFNRWGWTNGPLGPGEYEFDIYAGAGQCDTSKGTLAGKVLLSYDGSTAEVIYMTDDDHVLQETHLYIGNDPYPTVRRGRNGEVPTVAPGQFPYKHGNLDNVSMDSYTVDGLSGDIYIITHGVICELE